PTVRSRGPATRRPSNPIAVRDAFTEPTVPRSTVTSPPLLPSPLRLLQPPSTNTETAIVTASTTRRATGAAIDLAKTVSIASPSLLGGSSVLGYRAQAAVSASAVPQA